MKSIRLIGLALVPLLAAPAAFAQDASSAPVDNSAPHGVATNSTTGGDADAAFKRWAVVGSWNWVKPSNSSPLHDSDAHFKGEGAPTISASYFFTPNIAVELWGAADRIKHDVSTSEAGRVGSVRELPIALSAQYHFGTPDQVFRPFVGVGYYQSFITDEKVAGLSDVNVKNAKGAIGTAGVDLNINTTWFARFDARYMYGSPKVDVDGESTGEHLRLNPWTVGVGIGARF